MVRKINRDLINNVQKYLIWMPPSLREEIFNSFEEEMMSWKSQVKEYPFEFLIGSISRTPESSSVIEQSDWIWRIIEDLNLDKSEVLDMKTPNSSDIIWSDNNYGWNATMWPQLCSQVKTMEKAKYVYLDFRQTYGKAVTNLLFSQGKHKVYFINWIDVNPLEAKQ